MENGKPCIGFLWRTPTKHNHMQFEVVIDYGDTCNKHPLYKRLCNGRQIFRHMNGPFPDKRQGQVQVVRCHISPLNAHQAQPFLQLR